MRRSKSYEVRDPMNIWNKYDFAMSGLGKKSKILAKIKHFFKCVKWSKQRITRGYCDCDVWEMFSFLQTLIPDMLQTLKDTRTGSPGYLGENYSILIKMAQLNRRKTVLDVMRKRLPKSREEQRSYMSRNSVPEYRYINYDLELVKNEYELVSKSIMEMQMALDKYNQTVQFEVDI